jgi:hypothetical protein
MKAVAMVNLHMAFTSLITSITMILAATMLLVALTEFGSAATAQGQANTTSLTPEQKAAICNPSNPKLKVVNTTESHICGIPKTVKPHISNTTSSTNATTTSENNTILPSIVP